MSQFIIYDSSKVVPLFDNEEDHELHTDNCIICIEKGTRVIKTNCKYCTIHMHEKCFTEYKKSLTNHYKCPICRRIFCNNENDFIYELYRLGNTNQSDVNNNNDDISEGIATLGGKICVLLCLQFTIVVIIINIYIIVYF